MSAVLITVVNGTKVLDSGTGIVLCQVLNESKTYVLTCRPQHSGYRATSG